jgi:hypothetical protein
MAARPSAKPKMFDRVTAWQYAFSVIQSCTAGTDNEVPPGYAAIAAAILTVGNVDITDPMLAQVVDLMSPPQQHEGENDGNGS